MAVNKTLFVYGTLMFPELVHALTGKNFTSEEARLEDYSVRKIDDKPYPGLIKNDGNVANGLVLLDVDSEAYELIEGWEAYDYVATKVRVTVSGKEIEAETFVYIADGITSQNWDKDEFKSHNLDNFVNVRVPKYLKSKSF